MSTINQLSNEQIIPIISRLENLASLSQVSTRTQELCDLEMVWKKRFSEHFCDPVCRLLLKDRRSFTKRDYQKFLLFRLRDQAQEIMRLFMLVYNKYAHKIDTQVPLSDLFEMCNPYFDREFDSFHEEFKATVADDFDNITHALNEIVSKSKPLLAGVCAAYQLYRDREVLLDNINERIFTKIIDRTLSIFKGEIQDRRMGPPVEREGQLVYRKKLFSNGLITRLTQKSIDELFDRIPDIEQLFLDCNGLMILPDISLLASLRKIILQYNNLFALPDTLPALTHLSLTSNKFNHIPEVVWRTTSLKLLAFGNFAPSGARDICWDRFGRRVAGNTFSELSKKIESLRDLKFLTLSSVGLSVLPKELVDLKKLEIVVLLHNDIGNVPSEFASRSDWKIHLGNNPLMFNPKSTLFSSWAAIKNIYGNARDYALKNNNFRAKMSLIEANKITIVAFAILWNAQLEYLPLAVIIFLFADDIHNRVFPTRKSQHVGSFSGKIAMQSHID